MTFKDARQAGLQGEHLAIFWTGPERMPSPVNFSSPEQCLGSPYRDDQLRRFCPPVSDDRRDRVALCEALSGIDPEELEEIACELCGEPLLLQDEDGVYLELLGGECDHLFHANCLERYWRKKPGHCPDC